MPLPSHFLMALSLILASTGFARGTGDIGSGNDNFEEIITCVSAQGSRISVGINPFGPHDEIQLFHDGVLEEDGQRDNVYVLGSGAEGLIVLSTDGKREWALGVALGSKEEAGMELESGGLISYNGSNAREDYVTLSKSRKPEEIILMNRSKFRGEETYRTPHLLKCSVR